jgi:hypothetical protein
MRGSVCDKCKDIETCRRVLAGRGLLPQCERQLEREAELRPHVRGENGEVEG